MGSASRTNTGSGDNKDGSATNSGENNVVINGQKYKFNRKYIHQIREQEEAQAKLEELEKNKEANKVEKSSGNNGDSGNQGSGNNNNGSGNNESGSKNGSGNNGSGNNGSGNNGSGQQSSKTKTKLFKMHIEKNQTQKSSSGCKTDSKTASGSKFQNSD